MPSITPTVIMDAPSAVTMKIGNRLWIISEEVSMNSEPNPSAQLPAGNVRHAAGVCWEEEGLFSGGRLMPLLRSLKKREATRRTIRCRRPRMRRDAPTDIRKWAVPRVSQDWARVIETLLNERMGRSLGWTRVHRAWRHYV